MTRFNVNKFGLSSRYVGMRGKICFSNLAFVKYNIGVNLVFRKNKIHFQINFNWDMFSKITLKKKILFKINKKRPMIYVK
jgi:hypothetical protein